MNVSIEVSSDGPVDVAARAWRWRGAVRLTAIVKATFRIQPDLPLALAAPPARLLRTDAARSAAPNASIRRASECALFVRRPEIALDAIAFAGKRGPVEEARVGMTLARGGSVILAKELRVLGDRTVLPGDAPGRPVPFDRMPIVYERAYGGPGHVDNPVGTGSIAGGGRISMPNIVLGLGARVEPAGFGPIANSWPRRAARLAGVTVHTADEEPFVDLPDTFDDAYFQSAPLDQEVDAIGPGDILTFAGLHQDISTLRAIVPATTALAFADRRGGRTPIPVRIESIFAEPHALALEVVFRGYLDVRENELGALRVVGALHEPSAPRRSPAPAATREESAPRIASTMVLELPPPTAPGRERSGTMIIEPSPQVARGKTLPIPPTIGSSPKIVDEPAPRSVRRDRRRRDATLEISVDEAPRSLPFDRRGAKSASAAEPSADARGGTPWMHEAAKPVQAVDPRMQRTMIVEVEAPPAVETPVAKEAPVAAPAVQHNPHAETPSGELANAKAAPPPTGRKKAIWGNQPTGNDPGDAVPTPTKPGRRPVPAGPDARARLYGKFKR